MAKVIGGARGPKSAQSGNREKPQSSRSQPDEGFEQVFERIYRIVLRIPPGRVMTYGQIARLLEDRYSPRLVGWAMHAVPRDDRNIPWHRVINSRGGISTGRVIIHQPDLQRLLLEAEGVVFNEKDLCDLSVYQWSPRERKARAKIKSIRGQKAYGVKSAGKTATGPTRTKKKAKERK